MDYFNWVFNTDYAACSFRIQSLSYVSYGIYYLMSDCLQIEGEICFLICMYILSYRAQLEEKGIHKTLI